MSAINRLHGRTFLQKDLCYEIFHKRFDNSVFSVTNNYYCGCCGGGYSGSFWSRFAGGIGMGLGTSLMGILGGWLGGFGNMLSGCSPMMNWGGGFPMMNWWGGGAGGSNRAGNTTTNNTTTTGGSRVYNNYSNAKAEKNYDRKPLNKLEKRLGNLKKAKSIDPDKFKKLYIDVFNYTIQDSVDEDVDKYRLQQFKDELNKIAADNNLSKPSTADIKSAQGTPLADEEDSKKADETKNRPSVTPIVDNENEPSLLDKIHALQDGDIDGLLDLYPVAAIGQGEELSAIENKFRNGLNKIKGNPEKLAEVKEKIAGIPGLEAIYNQVIGTTSPVQSKEEDDEITEEPSNKPADKVIPEVPGLSAEDKEKFKKLGLNDIEIAQLAPYGKVNGNKFTPIKPLDKPALDLLGKHDIKVAFANNPNAKIDSWIIGKPKDIEETDGVKSYTIDCKDVGKFGLEFRVKQKEKGSNEYTVECISTVNTSSTYKNLYAAKGGRKYELGEDGVLHYVDNRGPVVSTIARAGYTRIPTEDEVKDK